MSIVSGLQVTKKTTPEQIDSPPRDGAYVHGLLLEGASWDDMHGVLTESKPKQLLSEMPIILIKGVQEQKEPMEGLYDCPVYSTERRFREEVFTAQLKTQRPWTTWATAGVCLILDASSAC
jgi:dynein heavy chain